MQYSCPPQPNLPEGIVSQDPQIVSGVPVFPGTRVPVRILQDCIQMGQSLPEFLADYPSVSEGQAIQVLECAFQRTIGDRDVENRLR